jgi:hypothetical protein
MGRMTAREQQSVTTQLKNTIYRAEFINIRSIFVTHLNNKYKYSHPNILRKIIAGVVR